jgi:ATP-dependent protease Clp ATPase subunit
LLDIMYELPDRHNVSRCIIDAQTVDTGVPTYETKQPLKMNA